MRFERFSIRNLFEMKNLQTDIVVIGAGLTGLTLAYYLQKAGKKVLLIEQSDRLGGAIRTITEDGFTYEAGPNTGVISTKELVQLFQDLNLEFEVPNEKAKARWIWKKGKWRALPTNFFSAIFTPLFTLRDKIRVLGEPFRRKRHRLNESVAKIVKRRLGKSILRYAVDPFISGIYAGDPKKLIVRYALPKLYALEQEYGSFVIGAIKKRKTIADEKAAGITKSVFSVSGGLENLIKALAEKIGNDPVLTGVRNVQVNPHQKQYTCSFSIENDEYVVTANKVITTIDGLSLAPVFPFIHPDVMEKICAIRYAKVVQVVVGYISWKGIPLEAFGGLIPSKEKENILGILFPSSLFKHRAPEGGALLSVFIGGIKHPELYEKSDEALFEIVHETMYEMLQCFHKPDLFRVFRYEKAIPQYESSTELRLFTIHEAEKVFPGIILAGNMRDGVGMSDRVKQAKQLADSILADDNQ
jgi:protoporphyrinogen/coproporphyrinogen III oxidase